MVSIGLENKRNQDQVRAPVQVQAQKTKNAKREKWENGKVSFTIKSKE